MGPILIGAMMISNDSKHLYISNRYGSVKKINLKTYGLPVNHRKIGETIMSMVYTPDGKNCFFGDKTGKLYSYCMACDTVKKDCGHIMKNSIHTMIASPDSKTLLLADSDGNLKLLSVIMYHRVS